MANEVDVDNLPELDVDSLPEMAAAAPSSGGFWSNLANPKTIIPNAIGSAREAISGLGNLADAALEANASPEGLIGSSVKGLANWAINTPPREMVETVGRAGASLIPVGNTAIDYFKGQIGNGPEMSPADAGKALQREMIGYGEFAGLGAALKGLGRLGKGVEKSGVATERSALGANKAKYADDFRKSQFDLAKNSAGEVTDIVPHLERDFAIAKEAGLLDGATSPRAIEINSQNIVKKLSGEVNGILNTADEALQQKALANGSTPPRAEPIWSAVDEVAAAAAGEDRPTILKLLEEKKRAVLNDTDGTIASLQREKIKRQGMSNYENTKVGGFESALDKAIASDLRTSIEKHVADAIGGAEGEAASKIVAKKNNVMRALFEMRDVAHSTSLPAQFASQGAGPAAAKVVNSLPGAAAGTTVGVTTGNPILGLGTAAAVSGSKAPTGMMALGKALEGGGKFMQLPSRITPSLPVTLGLGASQNALRNISGGPQDAQAQLPNPIMPQQNPFANGLPRQTKLWNDEALNLFVQNAATKEPEIKQIAFGMVDKLQAARKQGDGLKTTKIIADMAKLFPDLFEPGLGVDNQLFHGDDQKSYMDILKTGLRKGVVNSIQAAKQRNAFLDQNDATILPVDQGIKAQLELNPDLKQRLMALHNQQMKESAASNMPPRPPPY